jgi:hypothetical protein
MILTSPKNDKNRKNIKAFGEKASYLQIILSMVLTSLKK